MRQFREITSVTEEPTRDADEDYQRPPQHLLPGKEPEEAWFGGRPELTNRILD